MKTFGRTASTLLASVVFSSAAQAAAVPTLSFDISARVVSKDAGASRSSDARVLLRGERARIESRLGDQNLVVLWIKPYVYRLLPSSRSGVRQKASTPLPEMKSFAANWPALMNNPSKIRVDVKAKGAKKTGTATINGIKTEIYSASRWKGSDESLKIWLRQKDALPVKMETSSGDWKISVSWRNYRVNPKLSAALFEVPQGYRIRQSQ